MTLGACALPDFYYELRHQLNVAMGQAEAAIAEVAAQFAARFGRVHPAVERYHLDDAETAIVLMGASAGTAKDVVDDLRAAGERVGLLRIVSYRPFPAGLIRLALEGVKRVVVLDRSDAPGAYTSLQAEVATALFGLDVELRSHVFGLGGRELLPSEVHDVFAGHPGRYIGLRSGAR